MEDLRVLMPKKDFKRLHDMMGTKMVDKDDVEIHRMTTAQTKQDWYRQVLTAGMDTLYREYKIKQKEFENEV